MKRRILSILLLAALVIGLLPQGMLSVSAYSETDIAYPVEGGNLYFDKASGTITDCDNSVTGADIPPQIDGVAVTGIGSNAFKDCGKLISVTLPKSVTSIGDNAFSGCTYLSSTCDGVQGVIIPANVTSIDSLAFFGCECLQSVYFEGDAPEIGENVFTIKDPDSLWVDDIYVEYINIPGLTLYYIDGCTGWSFETWNGYHTMLWSGDPMNPEYPPLEPTEPTEPSEPEGFTAYPVEGGNLYFYSADGTIVDCDETVTYADVPAEIDGIAVTGIGSSAFEYCISLTGVTIPESVTSIDSYAFEGCESLQSACFLGDAPALGTDVFCMKEFVFDSGFGVDTETVLIPGLTLYYIDGKADWTTPTWNGYPTATWDGVNVPEPADEIAYPVEGGNLYFRKSTGEIFDCDTTVTNADIPEKIVGVAVTTIGDHAFYKCSNLTSVTIPSGVTSIGVCTFEYCDSLASVTIPNSIISINSNAFSGCSSLTSVTIPDSVTSIGNKAFEDCSSLQLVCFMGDAPTLGIAAFQISNPPKYFNIPGLTLYYIEGKEGWTSPTWNGYLTAIWDGVNVPETADEVTYPAEGGNLYFRKSTGEIYDCDEAVTVADIPAEIDGVAVTGIGSYAFEDCSSLTSVTIPDSVTGIGEAAFWGCTGLTSVTIPENITYISDLTFVNCSGLTEIKIPSSVTRIGNGAFDCCHGLTSVTIPDSVKTIDNYAFHSCSSLTSVTIPSGVTSIGVCTFEYCDSLASVTIPNSIISINSNAFYGCSSLTSVTIPDSVTSIGHKAFEDCSSLQLVCFMGDAPTLGIAAFQISNPPKYFNIPGLTLYYIEGKEGWTSPTWNGYPTATWDGVNVPEPADEIAYPVEGGNLYFRKSTGEIFDCDTTVTNADIPEKIVGVAVTTIGDHAFYKCSSLTSVTIPDSVTGICDSAFFACSSLTSVTIPEGVKSIGKQAFSYCSSLTSVTISGSVTSIGGYAFSYCSSLESVTIPGSVTSISDRTFYWCDSLTTVTILEGVTSIGGLAFGHCTGLTSVTIPDSVTNIGMSAFDNCSSLTSVTIPESVTSIGEGAFCDCSSLTAIHVAEGNTAYTSENGVLFDKNKTLLHTYPAGKTESEYIIPESVISIGSHAFYRCSNLTNVTIPVGVTSIVNYAFFMCSSLKSVTIPEGVKSISRCAFYGCSSLTSVTIPEGVKSIGISAFDACSSLTSVTIPGSVTSIGGYAFYACGSLQSLYFMGAAPALEAYAFSVWNAETQTYINNPNLILYYIDGKEGWTTPTWNSYPTATWMPVHEHSYVVVVTAPTCTEQGCTTHTCSICCDTYTDTYKEALGHDYGEWTLIKAATCTEKGEEKRTCSRCYSFETRETDAAGHTEVVDAAVPATCTEDGKTEGKHCDLCGVVIVAQETVAALGHDYGDWTQTKAPTCTEKGEEKRVCSRCDAFETREIAAHGHTEVVDAAIPATCTEAGKTEGKHCDLCGMVIVAQETAAALGHDYGDWTQTQAPTCTEKGEEKRVCSRCDAFETRELEAAGHSEVVDAAIPATCTEAGKTEGKHCDLCGTVIVAQETVAALGHDFGAWAQTKAPTCTETGEEKRVCSRCDAFEAREIAARGHTEVVDAAVPATCTEAGKTEGKHCAVCGTVIVAQEAVPALGHSYKDGVCTVCGAKDPDAQPAEPVIFTDVAEKAWYHDAVEYAVTNGLMKGVGGGKFDPEGTMTRAMLVTVLWRYEGEPAEGENTFTDVPDGTWYTGAVAWAAANGIVGGVGNGKFDPEGRITREQMATLLFRYAQKKGIDTSKRGELSGFPDSDKVSSWAKEAMRWAVAEGIINGSDGKLLPQGNATRAQVATLLMRFINQIEADADPTEPTEPTESPTEPTEPTESPTEPTEPPTEPPVDPPVDPKHIVTAGTRKLYIGMSFEDLLEYAGEAEEILPTTSGYTWYVYGTKDYTDYAMAGVYENKVVAICASGADFSYRGCTANGSVAEAEEGDTYHITILKDKNDNSAVYGILLTDDQFRVQYAATKEALAGESRVAFHMANAFRVLHNVGIMTWCDNAATAGRLHSEDMATQNYVSHTSADGRLFYMRLRENGVLYSTCAENLCAGYYNGIGANNAWVNSAQHRANLLNANMDRCGIGFGYGADSDYRYYAVADYYQAR